MANPYYYPASYVPYQPQYQPTYQPQYQQSPQPTQTSPTSLIWITSERDAAMYPIAPNAAVALFEQSGKRMYLKQADATGRPTLKAYDLVEHAEPNESAESASIPYATKNDVEGVAEALKGMDAVIAAIKADVDAVKGDLYGMVGKKKKKQEVDDDE